MLKEQLHVDLQRSMELASEKGASNWLSALPFEKYGFALHKGAFQDDVCLHYGWIPKNISTHCVGFTIDHALSCPTGSFPIIRHNELRDVTVSLLQEVCHDVCSEPHL